MDNSGETPRIKPAEVTEPNYGQEYSRLMAGSTTETYVRFGLNPDFVPILRDHLADLHIVVRRTRDETSHLTVQTINSLDEDSGLEATRLLVLDERDVHRRITQLSELINPLFLGDIAHQNQTAAASVIEFARKDEDVDEDEAPNYAFHCPPTAPRPTITIEHGKDYPLSLLRTTVDWIFAEQSVAALGNAYYMKNTFGVYVHDFDGQNENLRTELAVSAAYLAGPQATKLVKNNVNEDFTSMTSGFGLLRLRDSLISHNLVPTVQKADYIINKLKMQHYPTAFNSREIASHIQKLEIISDAQAAYSEIALEVYDDDIQREFDEEDANIDKKV